MSGEGSQVPLREDIFVEALSASRSKRFGGRFDSDFNIGKIEILPKRDGEL